MSQSIMGLHYPAMNSMFIFEKLPFLVVKDIYDTPENSYLQG